MPRVSYHDPSGVVRELTFKRRLRIGRHPSQDVQILDRVVSKEHAVLEVRDAGTVVFDVGSRNGTTLNGQQITGAVPLRDGDEIMVGSTTVKFFEERAEPAPAQTRVQILDEGFESAIRKRLKDTGNQHFLSADLIHDVEQLKSDYEKLRIANELNQAVSLEFDLNSLLNRILEKAFEMFAADRGVILLMDQETGDLEPAAAKARYEELTGGRSIRISKTILREVIEEKTAVLSSDAQMDSRFSGSQSIIMSGIKATMSVPLLYRDRILGVIHLDSQLAAGAFTAKDLSLLTGFANQAAIAIEHSRLVDRTKQEALAREQLARLLPQDVVDDVMQGKLEIKRGGTVRDVTVLFADIRGFTALSERYPAQDIVPMLNEYFEIMVEIIFRHAGTLDKFIGDEIMAVWGAPIALSDHTFRAVAAAVEMQEALDTYNKRRSDHGLEPIHVGIGVNTGEVVAGYMGSSKAMDYTVVGDVVNTGSRLCSAASAAEIIVSHAVVSRVGDAVEYEALSARALKGKREPVPLFRVHALR